MKIGSGWLDTITEILPRPGRLIDNESLGRTLQKVGKPLTKGLNSATRALSRTSTARQYMKDLLESRSNTSSLAYRKKAVEVRETGTAKLNQR